MRNAPGFQWDLHRKPPLIEEKEEETIQILPERVSVIVKNLTKDKIQNLNQSLKKMNLTKDKIQKLNGSLKEMNLK